MKLSNIYSYLSLAFAVLLMACEDDRVLPTLADPEVFEHPSMANDPTGSTVELSFEDAAMVFEEFTWSASDYGVGVPVKYTLQVDSDDTFETPFILASDLSGTTASVTVGEVNSASLTLGLEPFEEGDLSIRVIGVVVGAEVDTTVSEVIVRTVIPYVTEFEPIYMVGAAVGGWDWAEAKEVYGTGPSEYSSIAFFDASGDANFRFFEAFENWDVSWNYTFFGAGADPLFEDAGDGDNNLRFIGTTGYYRVTVNLKDQTVVMEDMGTEAPTLYMVGSGVPEAGWDWATPVQLEWIKDGLFEVTTEFVERTATEETAFRFFTINGDWNSGLNYPHYQMNEYDIDSKLVDAMDGDNNFALAAPSGTYKIVVNDIEKTIILAEAGTAGPPKYLVGDGTSAGWDWATPVELVQVEVGVFVGTSNFNTAGAFRVFSANGDWNSGVNYPTYIANGYTIDDQFEDAGDGDNNFKFNGVDGEYSFILDENNQTITLTFAPIDGAENKYLVGDGTSAGWDWATPVILVETASGVYKGRTAFNAAGAFRVFSINGDWNSGVNYPTYVADGYTVDAQFEDAGDDDNNFRFNGTDGTYIFTLDDNTQTITLE